MITRLHYNEIYRLNGICNIQTVAETAALIYVTCAKARWQIAAYLCTGFKIFFRLGIEALLYVLVCV